MRNRRKSTLVLIGLAVLVAVLRESTFWDHNNYKVTSEVNATSNFRNESLDAFIDSSFLHTKYSDDIFSEPSIIVVFDKNLLDRDSENRESVLIAVESIDPGFLWTPLYKSTTFTAAASLNFVNSPIKTSPANTHLRQVRITGHLKVQGTISIAGPCSHKQAKILVYNLVVEKLTTEAQNYISKLD